MSRKKSFLRLIFGLGDRIKKLRANLSQEQFGKLIGVNQGTIHKYEKGRAYPSEETLKKIADCGGVTVEWLLHGEEAPAPGPRLQEYAPEVYEARPVDLDVEALAKIINAARYYLRRHRKTVSARFEAKLIADLYYYWQTEKIMPDDQVIRAYLPLAARRS